ncbi:hypothetical protein F4778DRAFT_264599 [Xylariomycetidae sp. FL2044]|nr:hypothetical protein F4778DRAFT_264599 [Xylariomycetidae sp. FL2044]
MLTDFLHFIFFPPRDASQNFPQCRSSTLDPFAIERDHLSISTSWAFSQETAFSRSEYFQCVPEFNLADWICPEYLEDGDTADGEILDEDGLDEDSSNTWDLREENLDDIEEISAQFYATFQDDFKALKSEHLPPKTYRTIKSWVEKDQPEWARHIFNGPSITHYCKDIYNLCKSLQIAPVYLSAPTDVGQDEARTCMLYHLISELHQLSSKEEWKVRMHRDSKRYEDPFVRTDNQGVIVSRPFDILFSLASDKEDFIPGPKLCIVDRLGRFVGDDGMAKEKMEILMNLFKVLIDRADMKVLFIDDGGYDLESRGVPMLELPA